MIDTGVLVAFFLLWIVIVPTPGANVLLIIHLALTSSARVIAAAVAGNVAAFVLLGSAALLGWSTLLAAFPWLKTTLQIVGAAYLVYFALRLVLTPANQQPVNAPPEGAADATLTTARSFGLGFLTALSNAQAIVFITSIFAVSGVLTASWLTGAAAIAVMSACNSLYYLLVAAVLSRGPARRFYEKHQVTLRRTIGAIFGVLGVRLFARAVAEAAES
ncbi:MAG: LysE family transporter [Pseudomonadota bacterium]